MHSGTSILAGFGTVYWLQRMRPYAAGASLIRPRSSSSTDSCTRVHDEITAWMGVTQVMEFVVGAGTGRDMQ